MFALPEVEIDEAHREHVVREKANWYFWFSQFDTHASHRKSSRLAKNFKDYGISPDMVRMSLVSDITYIQTDEG